MATEQEDSAQAQLELQTKKQEETLAQNAAAANDAQKNMVAEAENAGVAAFTFDPDASPEKKREQARNVSQSSPSTPAPCRALLSRSGFSLRLYRKTFKEPTASRSSRIREEAMNR